MRNRQNGRNDEFIESIEKMDGYTNTELGFDIIRSAINAGVLPEKAPLRALSPDNWWEVVDAYLGDIVPRNYWRGYYNRVISPRLGRNTRFRGAFDESGRLPRYYRGFSIDYRENRRK